MSYNEEKRCACLADVKRRIFFSRRSKGWCEFSARLFNPLCCRCSTPGRISRFAARISLQLIGHDHTWGVVESFEELAKKSFRCVCVSSALDEDIQHVAVLIDGSPQRRSFSLDGEKDPRPDATCPHMQDGGGEVRWVRLTKLQTPLTHGFVGHDTPALSSSVLPHHAQLSEKRKYSHTV
jgi:hypothetical protein